MEPIQQVKGRDIGCPQNVNLDFAALIAGIGIIQAAAAGACLRANLRNGNYITSSGECAERCAPCGSLCIDLGCIQLNGFASRDIRIYSNRIACIGRCAKGLECAVAGIQRVNAVQQNTVGLAGCQQGAGQRDFLLVDSRVEAVVALLLKDRLVRL